MTEPEWLRQRGLACKFCGAPGHFIPIPQPVTLVLSDQMPTTAGIVTAVSCPEHRFLVRERHERLQDPRRFAQLKHGRSA